MKTPALQIARSRNNGLVLVGAGTKTVSFEDEFMSIDTAIDTIFILGVFVACMLPAILIFWEIEA